MRARISVTAEETEIRNFRVVFQESQDAFCFELEDINEKQEISKPVSSLHNTDRKSENRKKALRLTSSDNLKEFSSMCSSEILTFQYKVSDK